MSETFADLGVPFRLFEAPVADCSAYQGLGRCQLCDAAERHLFRVGYGGYLTAPCGGCGERLGFHVASEGRVVCHSCSIQVERPRAGGSELLACSRCLGEGRVLLTKDTSLGMIGWEHLLSGVTAGLPGLDREAARFPELELVQTEPPTTQLGERVPAAFGARLPRETMEELLRTPGFRSWQSDRWLFHGAEPMVFVGCWDQAAFARNAPDGDGRALFARIISDDDLDWRGLGDGAIYTAVFRSGEGTLRGYYDLA